MEWSKDANAFILVYDIKNKKSFEAISKYFKSIKENNYNCCGILVGNKCDEKDKREVSYEEGKNMSKKLNVYFLKHQQKVEKIMKYFFFIKWKRLIKF